MQLDESIRAELEVTCSTHPDNPFPISNKVTTCTDSRHFDSPVECRLFEDGSSSTVVNWQTTVGIYFQDPDISKNIFRFPPSRNKRHAQRVPSDVGNGQSKFGGDTMRCSGDIRARAKASAIGRKWCRRGRSQEDDHSLTFDRNELGVRKPNSAEIGLAVFEKRSNRRTDRQTDRHLFFIYMSVCLSVRLLEHFSKTASPHAEFIRVESEIVVVFLTCPTTTRFPADHTRFCSRANISGTTHRISAEFRLPVSDVGQYVLSVSFIAGDAGKRKIFLLISGS